MDRTGSIGQLKLAMKTLEAEQQAAVRDAEQDRAPLTASASVRPGHLWRDSGRGVLFVRLTAAYALVLALRPGEDPAAWQTAEKAVSEALEAYRRRNER